MVANIMWSTPKLSGKDLGAFNIQDAIQSGLKTYMSTLEAGARPTQLRQESLHNELLNKILGTQEKYSDENMLTDLRNKKLNNQLLNVNARYAQPKAEADLQGTRLGNEISRTNLQYLPDKLKAEIGQHIAAQQASLAQAENARNGGGLSHLTGVAADIASIQALEQKLGADNPSVQQAKQAFQLKQESQRGLNEYRKSLADSSGKRSSTNYAKLMQEENEIKKGWLPGSNGQIKLAPAQQQEALQQIRSQKLKASTDTKFREKAAFIANMDQSYNLINPEDLARYSGAFGTVKKGVNQLATPFGAESEEYDKYKNASQGAKVLAEQVSQFYGGSIQPLAKKAIEDIVNPSAWHSNPKLVLQEFNYVKNLLNKETGTYENALKDMTTLFGSKSTDSNDPLGLR